MGVELLHDPNVYECAEEVAHERCFARGQTAAAAATAAAGGREEDESGLGEREGKAAARAVESTPSNDAAAQPVASHVLAVYGDQDQFTGLGRTKGG